MKSAHLYLRYIKCSVLTRETLACPSPDLLVTHLSSIDLNRFSYLHQSLPYATWALWKTTNKTIRYSVLKDLDWAIPLNKNLDIEFLLLYWRRSVGASESLCGSGVQVCSVAEAVENLLYGHKVNKLTSNLTWPQGMWETRACCWDQEVSWIASMHTP